MQYIEDFLDKADYELSYLKVATDKVIPSEIKDAINYIQTYANFCYTNICSDIPFKQSFCFVNGMRSIKIEELNEENANRLIDIIKYSNNYFLKAKLYDIASIITKNKELKQLAAENYKAHVLSDSNNLNENDTLRIATKRALYLYHKIDKNEEKAFVHSIFSLQLDNTVSAFALKYCTATTLSEIKSSILKEFIPDIELLTSNIDMKVGSAENFLELLKILISYYSSANQSKNYFAAIDKYVLFCVEACNKFSPHRYHYLDDALNLISIDKLKDKYEDKINELLFIKDEEQKKAYQDMPFAEISLPKKLITELENNRKAITSEILSFQNGGQQLCYLLTNLLPTTKTALDKRLEAKKKSILSAINEIAHNKDGTILYESAYATEDEKRQFNIAEKLSSDLGIMWDILLSPFVYNLKIDDHLENMVASVLENNLFVPEERTDIIYKIIMGGLSRNIRKAVYDIIPQFEYGLTHYLKIKNVYPVMYRGSKKVHIDLNHILTSKKTKNKFRDKLVEIIGEDLSLELEYLLCNKFLGNLRNNNYHSGYGDLEKFNVFEVSAFYFILKAYCMGCD